MKRRYSKEKYQAHLAEIQDLKTRLKENTEQIENCDSRIEHGAISCEYRSLINEQQRLTKRLHDLERLDIEIVDAPQHKADQVEVDRTYRIKISDNAGSSERIYHLIERNAEINMDIDLSNPMAIRDISLESPVGRTINGRKVGEEFTTQINGHISTIKIIEEILENDNTPEM